MSDPLFPLPEPDFLFVHTGTVYRTSQGDVIDDEGWEADPTQDPDIVHSDVDCYLAPPTGRDVGASDVLTCVMLCSRSATVDEGDTFVIPMQDGLYPFQEGTWQVGEVRPNPAMSRVVLTRSSNRGQVDA